MSQYLIAGMSISGAAIVVYFLVQIRSEDERQKRVYRKRLWYSFAIFFIFFVLNYFLENKKIKNLQQLKEIIMGINQYIISAMFVFAMASVSIFLAYFFTVYDKHPKRKYWNTAWVFLALAMICLIIGTYLSKVVH